SNVSENGEEEEENEEEELKEGYRDARIQVLLAVAYSAGIGGTGTLTGTGTNLIFKGIVDEYVDFVLVFLIRGLLWGDRGWGEGTMLRQREVFVSISRRYGPEAGLNYGTWMAFNVPGLLLNVFIASLWLQGIFLFAQRAPSRSEEAKAAEAARAVINKKYAELGSMSFHELLTLILFVALVVLWLSRDPKFVPGWADWIKGKRSREQVISSVLDKPSESSEALLNWRILHEKMPWGLILLIGAGFAISKASEVSCMSYWLGQQMGNLRFLSPSVLVFIITLMTAMITEVASNTATASILLPVFAQLANVVRVNPLYLMLPATVACSYAFMLPVATPYNAIVFEATQMKTSTMMKAGFVMNVICVGVINLMINTLGDYLFDFSKFPDWADAVRNSSSSPSSYCNYTLY
ncbi:unnamed protein product, partial [Darwinula stevensoni]